VQKIHNTESSKSNAIRNLIFSIYALGMHASKLFWWMNVPVTVEAVMGSTGHAR